MSRSTGNLARMGTNTSVMQLDSYMPFQEIWLLIYQSISKMKMRLHRIHGSSVNSCISSFLYMLNVSGMFFTSMRTKMFH